MNKKTLFPKPQPEANQTVQLEVGTTSGPQSIRIGFTDQRLTAYGGMVVWSQFVQQKGVRDWLGAVLPHAPTSPNAYDPTDTALGLLGGILCGADKLTRVAHLRSDPALAEVLGIEAVGSQSTLSRFLAQFTQRGCEQLRGLHTRELRALPSEPAGYTLDLDSWSLVHEDGHQEGVRVGYTRKGLKPCHRPIVAALAEPKLVANFWLRPGNTACVSGAAAFLRNTMAGLPAQVRLGLLRADSGFASEEFLSTAEQLHLPYIVVAALRRPLQLLCRHDDSAWTPTDIPGLSVQEVEGERPGRRLIIVRQAIAQRPQAGGKQLLEVPGYKFQALYTNLPAPIAAVEVWRRYNGRADIENRIKELGAQFAIKGLCCRSFWATEAACHFAVLAYNLCVLLQRRLGQLDRVELVTLRRRLFTRAAVFSRAQGKPTLKLAVQGERARQWWRHLLEKLTAPPNCHAVGSLSARASDYAFV